MSGRIVLFGATGYTGGLVLESLRAKGAAPLLVGRNQEALSSLATRSGGLDFAIADATNEAQLSTLVKPGDVLISTVGPFQRYGHAAARAAVTAGAHYVDSTGELSFVLDLRTTLGTLARDNGSLLLPAFGYDYVPGVLAGALTAESADQSLRKIDVGYFSTGPMLRGLSQGTRTTLRDNITIPVPRFKNGGTVEQWTASEVRAFSVRGKKKNAFLVPGTETLYLPEAYPHLQDVAVFNGWFPGLSKIAKPGSALANVVSHIPLGQHLVNMFTRPMVGPAGGPDARERSRTRTHAVAVGRDASGRILEEIHLEGPSVYSLTGELIAWAALELASTTPRTTGVVGPLEAFGLDRLREGCAQLGLTRVHA